MNDLTSGERRTGLTMTESGHEQLDRTTPAAPRPGLPEVVDRTTWLAARLAHLESEKELTRYRSASGTT